MRWIRKSTLQISNVDFLNSSGLSTPAMLKSWNYSFCMFEVMLYFETTLIYEFHVNMRPHANMIYEFHVNTRPHANAIYESYVNLLTYRM